MKKNTGFTLIEVLVALAVTSIILSGAYMAFNSQQKTTTAQTNVSDMQLNLRAALDFISRDIRLAGCNPGKHDLGSTPASFGILDIGIKDTTSNMTLGNNYLDTGASYIRLSWDKNADGKIDYPGEITDYSLVDSTTITPGTTDLFMRNPQQTKVTEGGTKDVLASNIIAFGLAYAYDNNDDGELELDGGAIRWVVAPNGETGNWQSLNTTTGVLTDLGAGNSVDLDNIRAVRIWLLAESEAGDPNYRDTNTYIVGPHVVDSTDYRPTHRHRLLERSVFSRNLGLEVLTQ
nr:prepilin-type N-terminal cleavage/methylation domain-containing protein [uncultured Desulfuromonas sp.]